MGSGQLGPIELVGLLASDDRRRVVAALVLGASDLAEVTTAAALDTRAAAVALTRLVDSGLVLDAGDGSYHLLGEAFAMAARAAASARPVEEEADAPTEAAKVLRAFVREGRLTQIPASHAKRLVILDRLAQEFELGRRYSEAMVNLILGKWHADTAALRRYLVDDGLLDREHGQYWRTGGTVEP
jgi:hypothetical protein